MHPKEIIDNIKEIIEFNQQLIRMKSRVVKAVPKEIESAFAKSVMGIFKDDIYNHRINIDTLQMCLKYLERGKSLN